MQVLNILASVEMAVNRSFFSISFEIVEGLVALLLGNALMAFCSFCVLIGAKSVSYVFLVI